VADQGDDPLASTSTVRAPAVRPSGEPGIRRGRRCGVARARYIHALPATDHPQSLIAVSQPRVGIIMGSRSDRETMLEAARVLDELGIPYEMEIVSAHRTPDRMFEYAASAESRGLAVIIAGAGGAAHLPGMTAAKTVLPVLGVPVLSSTLNGVDSLLSIVQMPKGVPVATLAIGKAGAANAGLLAARILGAGDPALRERLKAFAERMADDALRPGA
jgi:5-(carboxyamino)imidazole ribonucleotide mutase